MNTHHHYLRLLRTLALAALTAAATAACTDDNGDPDGREPITPDDANPGIAVTFTADINPGSDANPAAAPGTRTVLTPTAEGGFTVTWKGKDTYAGACDHICIWAVKENTLTSPSSTDYVPTTSAASSDLMPRDENKTLTVPSPGDWTFRAVYGEYISGNGVAGAKLDWQWQSEPNNTGNIARYDFSVATATKNIAADDAMPQDISLGFKHLLSALQLRVTNATGAELTVREIRLSVKGNQIASQRYYDVATGGWKADGELKRDYLKLGIKTPAALATGGTSQDFHMLFFPEPAHSGKDMTITVITDCGEYTLTKKAPASPGFTAGKNYMTDIAIKSNPGTGETWSEYVGINTATELTAFRDSVNNGDTYQGKTVRLLNNIDLSELMNTWTPIGTGNDKPFSGTFDGGGYHISNLNVNYGNNNYAGLFGYVDGGTVRNLRVSGTVTTTGTYAGGIAGYLSGSTVENCIFDGTVSGNSAVGGIAGYSSGTSRIAGCHTKGKVTTTKTTSQNAGGIAGQNYGSAIDGCYSEAEVKADYQSAGGIAGSNQNGGTVTHCYATGKVSSRSSVGGIVGYQYNGTVTGCIALNPGLTRTEGNETTFGRIVGLNQGTVTVTSCAAYDGMTITDNASQPITSDATSFAGDDLTAAQCLTATTYTDRGFTTNKGWAFDDANTPWRYLPWNKAFENFPGLSQVNQYRISVPNHLKGGSTN